MGAVQIPTVAMTQDDFWEETKNALTQAPFADYDFFEDFGDDPNGSLDTTVWHHQVAASTAMYLRKDPESTDAQNGKGTSFYTNGVDKSFIEHTLKNTVRGKVSVDFYDDGVKQTGRMAQFNLTGVANKANGDKPFTIGLGINQNTGTQGFSHDNYAARIADDGRFIDTGIARTKGWHTFTIEVTAQGSKLSIDGKEVDTSAIAEKDVVTAFQNIHLGDKWGKGGETYFDNVRLENMEVVDLEGEEAAKKDASLKSIKVDGFSMPGLSADKTDYTWEVASFDKLPTVTVNTNHADAKAVVTQATAETKKATITVTAADGVTTKTYTVSFVEASAIDEEWGSSFEGENALDLWETLDARGEYTEVTEEQAHEGTKSFVTRGTADKKSWIFKKFDGAVTGKVSVWFYDTMGKFGKESFQQVNLWAPFDDVNAQPAINGIGTQGGSKTYSLRVQGAGYQATKVERTEGWHEFVFDVTPEGTTFFIDGNEVYHSKTITSFGAIQMGDIWSTNGATAYYDDVTVTNLKKAVSGVALDQEAITLPSGETFQLNAKVLPVGTTSDVVWTSANENIAKVDENGLVTAGSFVGTTTITATVKGIYTATCEVTVTKAAQQDASLKNIQVNGKDLNGFKFDKIDYELTIADGKVPTVTAVANQPNAKVEITPASKVPGVTTIEVTAPDGVTKELYTINFNPVENIFFDDFSYSDPEDLEKRGKWDVQEGTGRRPGNRTWWWKKDNVVLMEDEEDPTNTFVRLKAKTDGTGGENTSQAQIRYYEEKFGTGTYTARVWLYDNVMEAETEAAFDAKDQALSTFFTINRIQAPTWEPYHESDFEYLFNGGWGGGPKTMWYTTWNSYAVESSSEAQRNQSSSTGPSTVGSLDGKWTTLTLTIDESGRTTYYIDGKQMASHANKDKVVGPQSIAFNLWFIGGGQDTRFNGQERTYWEDVDWVYYTPELDVTTAEIEETVANMKAAGVKQFDEIDAPDVTLKGIQINGKELSSFDNDKTEYYVTLEEGTTETPSVTVDKNSEWSIVNITHATELPGATTITVQSSDLSVIKTFHINFTVKGNNNIPAPLSNIGTSSAVKYRDVQLFHSNPKAEIYYTMDGTTPTTKSTKYNGEVIRVEESTNIKAIAVVDGKESPVGDFLYTVIPMTPQVTMHPESSHKTGTYEGTQYVTLTVPEELQRFYEVPGRTDYYKIYYTTDGTIPTANQFKPNPSTKLYTGPIKVEETTTINFTAVLPGICESYESTEALRNQHSRVTLTILPKEEHTHTETIVGAKDATCTEEGYTGDKVCSECGEIIEKGTVIPALGHDYDENGDCTICGGHEWEEIGPSEPVEPSIPWTPIEPSAPIEDKEDAETPDTGDKAQLGLFIALMALAGSAIAFVTTRKKCEE